MLYDCTAVCLQSILNHNKVKVTTLLVQADHNDYNISFLFILNSCQQRPNGLLGVSLAIISYYGLFSLPQIHHFLHDVLPCAIGLPIVPALITLSHIPPKS